MSNKKQASKSRESNLHEYSDIEHRILDAAREVFIRKGYDSATMAHRSITTSGTKNACSRLYSRR